LLRATRRGAEGRRDQRNRTRDAGAPAPRDRRIHQRGRLRSRGIAREDRARRRGYAAVAAYRLIGPCCVRGDSGKRLRVVPQVVLDEALDEPVAVVVTGLDAQLDRLTRGAAGFDEQFGPQLTAQERVGVALVDEDGAGEVPSRAYQFEGVVGLPRFAITQVARESLRAPRHLGRRDHRGERGYGAIAIRV